MYTQRETRAPSRPVAPPPSSSQRGARSTGNSFGRLGLLKPKIKTTVSEEANSSTSQGNNSSRRGSATRAKPEWRNPGDHTPEDSASDLLQYEMKQDAGQLPPYESLPISQFYSDNSTSSSSSFSNPKSQRSSGGSVSAGFRPSEIVATAREMLRAPPSSKSNMNTNYISPTTAANRHHLPASITYTTPPQQPSHFIPRPPVATTGNTQSQQQQYATSNGGASIVITAALSDQALDALADAQLQLSGLHHSSSVASHAKLPAFNPHHIAPSVQQQPLAYPSKEEQQQLQQQQIQQQLFSYAQQQHSLPPSALSSFESILRGPLSAEQNKSLLEAGGANCLQLLTTIYHASSQRRWSDLEEMVLELQQRRLAETESQQSTGYIEPNVERRINEIFDRPECMLLSSKKPLSPQEMSTLYRAAGLCAPSILAQLSTQNHTYPSLEQLAFTLGSFGLRAALHVLVLQPILLPKLFQINTQTGRYECLSSTNDSSLPAATAAAVGWLDAVEWLEFAGGDAAVGQKPDPITGKVAAGPEIVSILQRMAEKRMVFATVDELKSALRSEVSTLLAAAPSAALAAAPSSAVTVYLADRKETATSSGRSGVSTAASSSTGGGGSSLNVQPLFDFFNNQITASRFFPPHFSFSPAYNHANQIAAYNFSPPTQTRGINTKNMSATAAAEYVMALSAEQRNQRESEIGLSEIQALLQETSSTTSRSRSRSNNNSTERDELVDIVLLYLRTLERLLMEDHRARAEKGEISAEDMQPFFKNWKQLIQTVKWMRKQEAGLRAFFVNPENGGSELISSFATPQHSRAGSVANSLTSVAVSGTKSPPSKRTSVVSPSSTSSAPVSTLRPYEVAQINLIAGSELLQRMKIQQAVETEKSSSNTGEQQSGSSLLQLSNNSTTTTAASAAPAPQKPHPMLAVLSSLIAATREEQIAFSTFSSLYDRLVEEYDELLSQTNLESMQLFQILRDARGTILHEASIVSPEDVTALLKLCGDSYEIFSARLQELAAMNQPPRFKNVTLLAYHFQELNARFQREKADLYHYLHNINCPLFITRGGGASIYTQVTVETIEELVRIIAAAQPIALNSSIRGPSPQTSLDTSSSLPLLTSTKPIWDFINPFLESKTKLKSVNGLLELAREHSEIQRVIHSKRHAVQRELHTYFREFLKNHPSLFEPIDENSPLLEEEIKGGVLAKYQTAMTSPSHSHWSLAEKKDFQLKYASRLLAALSSDHLQSFFRALHIQTNQSTHMPSPCDPHSIQTLCICLEQLLYWRKSYDRIVDDSSEDINNLGESVANSELIQDLLRLQTNLIRNEKKSCLTYLQTHASTKIATIASSPLLRHPPKLYLLPLGFVQTLSLNDMDEVFLAVSEMGFNARRVLHELHALQMIEFQLSQQNGDEEPSSTVSPNSKLTAPSGPQVREKFEDFHQLLPVMRQHYHRLYKPLRTRMQDKLLSLFTASISSHSSASVLLPAEYLPNIEELDMLIDVAVIDRAFETSREGLWNSLIHNPSNGHMDFIRENHLQVAPSPATNAKDAPNAALNFQLSESHEIFIALVQYFFHELIKELGLLSESNSISCENISPELIDEVFLFRREQLDRLKSYLQTNATDIFEQNVLPLEMHVLKSGVNIQYSSQAVRNGNSTIDWNSESTRVLLEMLLSNFYCQSQMFENFYNKHLAKRRALAKTNELIQEKWQKGIYHSSQVSSFQLHSGERNFLVAPGHTTSEAGPSGLKTLPPKCNSVSQFLSHVDLLLNQRRYRLRTLQNKVMDSYLLPTTASDTAQSFSEANAEEMLDLLKFVPDEKQLNVAGMLLVTLKQQYLDSRASSAPPLPSELTPAARAAVRPPYETAAGLLKDCGEVIRNELNEMCQFLTADPQSSPTSGGSRMVPRGTLDELTGKSISSGGSILSLSLQTYLSDGFVESDIDACEKLWIDSEGSVFYFRLFVFSIMEQGSLARMNVRGVVNHKVFDALDDLLREMEIWMQNEIEREINFKSMLYKSNVIMEPNATSDMQLHPTRLALQRILALCRELGSVEITHTVQYLRDHVCAKENQGKPFVSIAVLDSLLKRLVDFDREQKAKAAAAELARLKKEAEERARIEKERQEKLAEERRIRKQRKEAFNRHEINQEALRAEIRTFLSSSSQCTLFTSEAAKRNLLLAEIMKSSLRQVDVENDDDKSSMDVIESESTHVLDRLLAVGRNDLSTLFRAFEGLMSQQSSPPQAFQVYSSFDSLIVAVQKQIMRFDMQAAELISWIKTQGNSKERVLPNYIVQALDESKEGVALLTEFDKDAQLGPGPIRVLIESVTDARLEAVKAEEARHALSANGATAKQAESHLPAAPAFTSFQQLFVAMQQSRSEELALLHGWLETPSASMLFSATKNPDGSEGEMSATEGEIQRLLLSAPSFHQVYRALQLFLSQSREFPSLTALAHAVTEEQEIHELSVAGVLSYLDFSGLLQIRGQSLSREEEKEFRAWIDKVGVWRVENELISIQQMRDAEASSSPDAIKTDQGLVAAPLQFEDLMQLLRARHTEAILQVQEYMDSKDGKQFFSAPIPTNFFPTLLAACIDVSLLNVALEASPNRVFDSLDLLSLAVRRYAHAAWLTHQSIQQSVRDNQLLAQLPHTQLLSQFDSSYLLSLMSSAELIDAFSSERFKGKKAFPNVESLVNAVAELAEWKANGMKYLDGDATVF